MNKPNALIIILIGAALAIPFNATIHDIKQQSQCKQLGLEFCARCFDIYSDYAPINLKALCYECADGNYYWSSNKCTPLPNKREISGWGRSCAECGRGNYWSAKHDKCMPCTYESAHCQSGNCCNETVDFNCTSTFTLDHVLQKCKCEKGDHFKVYDKCYCVGQDDVFLSIDYEDGSIICEKCTNRCPTGCEKHDCGLGFYLDGCECKPVHYSCEEALNASEYNCISCKAPFEKVELDHGRNVCLCPCCSIENLKNCVPSILINPANDFSLMAFDSTISECKCDSHLGELKDDICYRRMIASGSQLQTPEITEPSDFDKLDEWISSGHKCNYTLIYTQSTDGANEFHKRVDYSRPTVTIINASMGRVIGFYTDQQWGLATDVLNYEPMTFLFTLTKGKQRKFDENKYALLNSGVGPILVRLFNYMTFNDLVIGDENKIWLENIELTTEYFGTDNVGYHLDDYQTYKVDC